MDDEDVVNQRLDAWVADLCAALGVEREAVVTADVLALAGDAAHAVVRPAAPVTTFVVGYAAGLAVARGQSAPEALAEMTAVARGLCTDAAGG